MIRVGRKILIAFIVILPFFLSWVTTMAAPSSRIQTGFSTGTNLPVHTEATGQDNISLILLGAGIMNMAIWGRSQYRRRSTKPDESR